jgi:hypothetical protein
MDVAHNAGMSFRNYQRLENGDVLPRVDTLLRLSQELKLPPSTLLECLEKDGLGFIETHSDFDLSAFEVLKNRAAALEAQPMNSANLTTQDPSLTLEGFCHFEMQGNLLVLDEHLHKKLQTPQNVMNLELYLVGARPVDIWEYISRKKIKTAKIITLLLTPSGFHFLEGYYYILSANPDNARALAMTRDCSDRFEFKDWVERRHHENSLGRITAAK